MRYKVVLECWCELLAEVAYLLLLRYLRQTRVVLEIRYKLAEGLRSLNKVVELAVVGCFYIRIAILRFEVLKD